MTRKGGDLDVSFHAEGQAAHALIVLHGIGDSNIQQRGPVMARRKGRKAKR